MIMASRSATTGMSSAVRRDSVRMGRKEDSQEKMILLKAGKSEGLASLGTSLGRTLGRPAATLRCIVGSLVNSGGPYCWRMGDDACSGVAVAVDERCGRESKASIWERRVAMRTRRVAHCLQSAGVGGAGEPGRVWESWALSWEMCWVRGGRRGKRFVLGARCEGRRVQCCRWRGS